jgi:ubiquinone/menaquinone biosynthesis C-methylase UbiE
MEARHLYNTLIADHYDRDPFDILARARARALEQIDRHVGSRWQLGIDLATGTGQLLLALRERQPTAEIVGVDISDRMLELAARRLAERAVTARLIRDDALAIGQHFEPERADVIAVHFILAYVDTAAILAEAHRALRPGGYLSLASTTYESFPVVQQVSRMLMGDEFVDTVPSPASGAALAAAVEQAGFTIEAQDLVQMPIRFDDPAHFFRFGHDGGWFTHYFAAMNDAQSAAFQASAPFFPMNDDARVSVLIARKAAGV